MTTTTTTRLCSVGGCGEGFYCKLLCRRHYNRLRRKGAVGPAERFRAPWGTGYVDSDGYRVIHAPGHPLARRQGKTKEHRVVLFDALAGCDPLCHWCGVQLAWDDAPAEVRVNVDHLDWNRLNNALTNLVPSCLDCNTKRRAA